MGDAAGHQEPARVPRRRLSRSFLILHGLEGSGPDHWQTWLAGRLRERGETVRYPDLPDPCDPYPDAWLAALEPELAALDGERVVLCHSLATLLWMLHAKRGGERADRVLLVAPPWTEELEPVVRFDPWPIDPDALRRAAGRTRMICSDGDPYCPRGAATLFGDPLELDYEVIAGGGHLNTDAGYGPWPEIEDWALAH